MLVLTRKISEQVVIGDDIVVTIVKIDGNKVRVGIEAPPSIGISRREMPRRQSPGAEALSVEVTDG
jgi:carbon storage regulator